MPKNHKNFTVLKSTRDRDESAIKELVARAARLEIKTDDIVTKMENALAKLDSAFGERYKTGGTHPCNLEDEGLIDTWYGTLLRLEADLATTLSHYDHYLKLRQSFNEAEARLPNRPSKVVLVVGEAISPTIASYVAYAAERKTLEDSRDALDECLEALKARDIRLYNSLDLRARAFTTREFMLARLLETGRLVREPVDVPAA